MTDRTEGPDKQICLSRREFTLDAALAILAGCVITVSGCGDNETAPTPPVTDVSGVIANNHNHTAVVTAAQITAGGAISLNIQGTAAHPHTVALTDSDLSNLKNRRSVQKESSTDVSATFGTHSHTVTFTPA